MRTPIPYMLLNDSRPLLSLQTCNTWSDSCGSHLACSGVNIQVSPSPDEVIFWQAVAATGSSGPHWGTGRPTFPPITHFLPFYLLLFFITYHPRRQAGSQITFFNILHILSLILQQKDFSIFRIELHDTLITTVVFHNTVQNTIFYNVQMFIPTVWSLMFSNIL